MKYQKDIKLFFKLLILFSLFITPSFLYAWGDNSCPGSHKDTLYTGDKSWSGSFQVRKNTDPNYYIYFSIDDDGYIDISAQVGSYNRKYNLSVSKSSCGGDEIYSRTSKKIILSPI